MASQYAVHHCSTFPGANSATMAAQAMGSASVYRSIWRIARCWPVILAAIAILKFAAATACGQVGALRIEDFAALPISGSTVFPAATANSAYLARPNFLAEEPGGSGRLFVNDLNGALYILDKATRQFVTYLDFNGRGSAPGLFNRFVFSSGFANGLITFEFDPDYVNNGKFYTVHMEEPNASLGSQLPDNTLFPGFNTAGYAVSTAIDSPGNTNRQTVLIEWTDASPENETFEGTAREVLRLDMVGQIHPLGDLQFNPLARPGDPDWRVLYVAVGDGGAGEQSNASTRLTPQRLDSLGGKILRIIPDLAEHAADSVVSSNGRYRIPADNPFTSIPDSAVRDEIFATGLRNPHRMSWDVNPANTAEHHLIVNDIGLHTWEEVNIIYAGRNYGYSQREGNELLQANNQTTLLPLIDLIPLQITGGTTGGVVTPTYPVAQYGHSLADSPLYGDSISSGFVYRGSRVPELYGKYVFGDISTGQLFYADFAEMLTADDGDPATLAAIHSLNLLWDDPADAPNAGLQEYGTIRPDGAVLGPLFQIVTKAYKSRGGQDPNLPGSANVTSPFGRADIRLQVDAAGELYILSKSDGMIRAIVGNTPSLLGDYNRDGRVDASDYVVWRRSSGQAVAPFTSADGDGSGHIDAADYNLWRSRFGDEAVGFATNASLPEPSGAALVAGAALLSMLVRATCRRPSPPLQLPVSTTVNKYS